MNETVAISTSLVREMVAGQFPEWADLPIEPVEPGGWDNRSFRLGADMLVRLPSAECYTAQVEKEQEWLPRIAPCLPLPIPDPLALGRPAEGYPWNWSVYRWIAGDTASADRIDDLTGFATDLGRFLTALYRVDPTGGPPPGPHNFFRGGSLTVYDAETRRAIAALDGQIDTTSAAGAWDAALGASWHATPVWVHGDVSPGNLLLDGGRLSAVIDFGCAGVGDPACDLAIAWTCFHGESRKAFQATVGLDDEAWTRGRGWALWKALITVAGIGGTDPAQVGKARHTIDAILSSHENTA